MLNSKELCPPHRNADISISNIKNCYFVQYQGSVIVHSDTVGHTLTCAFPVISLNVCCEMRSH